MTESIFLNTGILAIEVANDSVAVDTSTLWGAIGMVVVYIGLKFGLPKLLEMRQLHDQKKTESAMAMLGNVLDALIKITAESQKNNAEANKTIESLSNQTTAMVTILQSIDQRLIHESIARNQTLTAQVAEKTKTSAIEDFLSQEDPSLEVDVNVTNNNNNDTNPGDP